MHVGSPRYRSTGSPILRPNQGRNDGRESMESDHPVGRRWDWAWRLPHLPLRSIASDEAYFALDNQDFVLLELSFQALLQVGQEVARNDRIVTDDAVDAVPFAISRVSEFQELLIGLGEIRQPLKSLQEAALPFLEFG